LAEPESFFPILSVADLARSLDFYVGLLGLEAGYRWAAEGAPRFVVVSVGESALGLSQADAGGGGANGAFELCVYTTGVDETVEALRARGVPVLQEPEDMPWGERMAYVADPDGNRVHVTERSSDTVTSS
jgi:lactoylglutathione lyase